VYVGGKEAVRDKNGVGGGAVDYDHPVRHITGTDRDRWLRNFQQLPHVTRPGLPRERTETGGFDIGGMGRVASWLGGGHRAGLAIAGGPTREP